VVAALYIDPRGPYPKLLVAHNCYDEKRDARTYAGPWPVVAHPPCGPWGRLRQLPVPNRERRDYERGLALEALGQVRRWGGCLEHPRYSALWPTCGLPLPGELPDAFGGVTIEIDQVDFGHVARKSTWIYLVGVRHLGELPPHAQPTHWVSGGRTRCRKGSGGIVPAGIKVCSAPQRRRTPLAFAKWLVQLAQQASPLSRAESTRSR